jgi:hypothetical protein
MEKMGLIKQRVNNKKNTRGHSFALDTQFNYLQPLQNFLTLFPIQPATICHSKPHLQDKISEKSKKT